MTGVLLDGNAIARSVYSRLEGRIAALKRRGIQPGLAAVEVGGNAASLLYIRNKTRACVAAGLHSEVHNFPADCSESSVLATVDGLNRNPRIHGIVVQLPLPGRFDALRITQSISSAKDVDGFGWRNLGALVAGYPLFVPGTPLGIMHILQHEGIALEGRHAVVVGRSTIVGKPMALLLIGGGATVTVCNSRTPDLSAYTKTADILVVAAGRPGLVDGGMIKEGAVVIDVGINRLPDGRLVGDVDFESARPKASYITPVPGGVGPMTVAMLVANTVSAAEKDISATGCGSGAAGG